MRKVVQVALMLSLSSSAALAQERLVYSPLLDLGDQTSADLRLIEESAGAKTKSMTLDLCFASNVDTSNGVLILGDYDRVVVPLKADANSLTGAASSSEAKQAVTVNLHRRAAADGKVSFTGTISIGGKPFQVSADPVVGVEAMEETAFLRIVEKPEAFDETAAPNAIAVKIRRGNQPQLIEFLRTANVKIDLTSGAVDKCAVLRSGDEYLRVFTPPAEAEALIARLKKLPFVTAAGWTGAFTGSPTARVSNARWVIKGVLNREKAAGDLSAAIAKHIGASVTGTSWDPRTGELRVTLKRPSKLFPGLGLTENFVAVSLVAPERFGETDRALIWGPNISGDVADEGAGARLSIVPLTLYAGPPEGIQIYVDPEILAGLLEGEWWDSANNAWVKR